MKPSNHARAAFTLVELVVVISILALLAGLVAPRVSSWTEKSRYAKAESELKGMARAINYLMVDVGKYPADVGPNIDPGLNNRNRVPTAIRDHWEGPYMEKWPNENPWGGTYDYEYWNSAMFNQDGTAGNEVIISMRGNLTTAIKNRIDKDLDDGNGATGMIRHSGNWLGMYVGEGPRW